MTEYTVVFEWAGGNYSAYVPDLPGCVSTGATIDETEANVREAIDLYLETLAERGQPVPPATTLARAVRIAA